MKIKELLEKLQQFDPELEVLVEGYEGGWDAPVISDVKEFEPNVNTEWYYGRHEQRKGGSMKAIVLEKPTDNEK
jgi:hypothetical protein